MMELAVCKTFVQAWPYVSLWARWNKTMLMAETFEFVHSIKRDERLMKIVFREWYTVAVNPWYGLT